MSILEQAYQKAIEVLKKCESPRGLYASGAAGGYHALWARDAVISLLGGSLVGNDFKEVFKTSLDILVQNQSSRGQIPNCVGDFNPDRNSDVTFTTIDSSLWFVIGEDVFQRVYQDESLWQKHKKAIEKTITWLSYQDLSEDHLIEQQPTSDWQDACPHKYGHTISTQALYYAVLKILKRAGEADLVKKIVNGQDRLDLKMFDEKKGYYLPWIWKNHDGDREQSDWFDSLGNLLAIISQLAEQEQAKRILDFIERDGVNEPFPVKCIFPPIKKGEKEWHSYFEKCDAREPFCYLNGGIWPFIGGFYVAALVKAKKLTKAKEELASLAEANKQNIEGEWGFNEWLDGIEGKPTKNNWQAWSAGMYIFAFECVKRKRVPWF